MKLSENMPGTRQHGINQFNLFNERREELRGIKTKGETRGSYMGVTIDVG